jgi:hypothetical protein
LKADDAAIRPHLHRHLQAMVANAGESAIEVAHDHVQDLAHAEVDREVVIVTGERKEKIAQEVLIEKMAK